MDFDFAAKAIIGKRAEQQDAHGSWRNPERGGDEPALLAVVADGLGGMPAGDRASGLAVESFLTHWKRAAGEEDEERLVAAVRHAHDAVLAASRSERRHGMCTTLVAAAFHADRCAWLSVGDSYLLACRGGEQQLLNEIHADVFGGITSAVGYEMPSVSHGARALEPGDVLVLASDGVDTLGHDPIAAFCAGEAGENPGAQRIADRIIAGVEDARAERQDNATVFVVKALSTSR